MPCKDYKHRPGRRFQIVTVQLLVPCGESDYADLLSDFRDDHPTQLVEWSGTGCSRDMSKDDAQIVWKHVAGEPVTIHEAT